jgi:sugar phosphate isomerase/epimerase
MKDSQIESIHPNIVACYLYIIGKYGYPPAAGDTLAHMEEFSALGFSSIELEGIRAEHLGQIYEMRELIREKADTLNLNIPVFCIVLPGLSSADPLEREENLKLFEKGCEIAGILGASAVLDNAPLLPWQFPEGIPITRHYEEDIIAGATLPDDLNWKNYWDGLTTTYREACQLAAYRKMDFHLHPCLGALVSTTDAFLNFARKVKCDNLKFNMDTANQFFLKDNLLLSLQRLEGHIDYIHLSDNRGFRVEHLVPGQGNIPWESFFETLDKVNFKGLLGIDIGGAESDVTDYDSAYKTTAGWIHENWFKKLNR